jgi:hypothetical protein
LGHDGDESPLVDGDELPLVDGDELPLIKIDVHRRHARTELAVGQVEEVRTIQDAADLLSILHMEGVVHPVAAVSFEQHKNGTIAPRRRFVLLNCGM